MFSGEKKLFIFVHFKLRDIRTAIVIPRNCDIYIYLLEVIQKKKSHTGCFLILPQHLCCESQQLDNKSWLLFSAWLLLSNFLPFIRCHHDAKQSPQSVSVNTELVDLISFICFFSKWDNNRRSSLTFNESTKTCIRCGKHEGRQWLDKGLRAGCSVSPLGSVDYLSFTNTEVLFPEDKRFQTGMSHTQERRPPLRLNENQPPALTSELCGRYESAGTTYTRTAEKELRTGKKKSTDKKSQKATLSRRVGPTPKVLE